jgi:hypothetical protein
MIMRKKAFPNESQLSLFEPNEPSLPNPTKPRKEPTTVLDFVKARFEHGPDMTQEEYRRWIKILINNSLKSMD